MAFSNLQHYDKFQEINIEQLSSDLTSSPISLMGDGGSSSGFSESVFVVDAPTESSKAKVAEGSGGDDGIPQGKAKAARPRGGGIGEDEQKSRRDYRRFSATTMPPEHQPAYQPKHATELPTHEHPSGSAVGCGSLPGSSKEFGVARLPDERGNSNPYIFSQATLSETVFTPHSSQPFKSMMKHQRGFPSKPQQPQPQKQQKAEHAKKTELPTKEVPSGSRVGVGSLPGDNSEAGVATLPEEREGGKPYGSGYTGFEGYSPAEGAKMMHRHMHEHSHKHSGRHAQHRISEKIGQHFEHGDQSAMPKVDLPIEEEPSGSRMGVGSLPGPNSEAGVALLPEERRHHLDDEVVPSLFMPTTEDITISYGGVGSLPGKRNEQNVAMTPEERLFPADGILGSHLPPRMDEMPLEEHPSGSIVGVGSLPGTIRESGVAILPDERAELGLPVDAGTATLKQGAQRGPRQGAPSKGAKQGISRGREAKQGIKETKKGGPKDVKQGAPRETKQGFLKEGKQGIPREAQQSASKETKGETREERMEREIRGLHEAEKTCPHKEWIRSWGMERKQGVKNESREEEGAKASNHDKIKNYFQKVDHHVMLKVDLPIEEEPSGSYTGVGSLPGPRTESGVAVLPEERKHHMDNEIDPAIYMPSTEDQMLSVGGVGSLPGKRSEQGVAMLPEERLFPADEILTSHLPPRADQLPSTEQISGSVIGVGSLPGKRSEQRVALTPEERIHPADEILMSHLPPRMDQLPSREHLSGSAIGVGSLPGQRSEKGVALTPEERQHPADQILMRKTKQRPSFGKGGHGQSRRKSEGGPAHAHTSGFQTRSHEGQARRRGEREVGQEEQGHEAEGGAADLGRKPSLHGRPASQQKAGQGQQQQQQQQPQQQQQSQGVQRTMSAEIEEERKRVEHHFEMARKAAELVGAGMTTAVEGVGSVVTGITAPHYHQPQTPETIEADRQRAQQRGEMMRHTMERFENSIEGVGNRVRHAFGWDHPASAGPAAPASQAPVEETATPRVGPAPKTAPGGGSLSAKEIQEQQQKRVQAERLATQEQQARLDRVITSERMRAQGGAVGEAHGDQQSTMQILEGGVSAAAEGVGKGIGDMGHALEDMGHRVWESMGKHPGGFQPISAAAQKVASNVPGVGHFVTVPSGGSTESTHAVHSNLSPTAPAFVPSHFHATGQQHGEQEGSGSSWWPHVGGPPPLTDAMKDMREKVGGYLHLGHAEEGQPQGKGDEARRAPPPSSATPTMDRLAGHATRASDRGGKVSDRAADNCENVDRGTTDDAGAREDDARLRDVKEAEELLRRAAHEEQKPSVVIGKSEQGKPAPLSKRNISEATLQKEAGAEGEVTTLESSGHLGSAKAPLGMPTRQEGKQTSIPSNLYEQYFATAGKEGEVTTLEGTGGFGTTRPAQDKQTLKGVGGVGFTMQPGEGGVLPGYPTAQGMSQMMQERIADDKARAGGKLGGETTTNTLKSAPHLESNIGPLREKMSRAQSDISVQAVHGSTSDLGAEVFTGNKTPGPVGMASPMGMLGAPVSKHGQQQHGPEYGRRHTQKN